MTPEEFYKTLVEMESMVLDQGFWPSILVIDPSLLHDGLTEQAKEYFIQGHKIVKYKLPLTGEIVEVEDGEPGEIRIESAYVT